IRWQPGREGLLRPAVFSIRGFAAGDGCGFVLARRPQKVLRALGRSQRARRHGRQHRFVPLPHVRRRSTMKLSIHRRLRRRDLMKVIGSAALALPLLELFEDEVRAQATPKRSKFAVFLYTPDGVNNPAFWPTGTDPTSSPTLSVFAPYKDKVLVFGPRFASPGVPTDMTGLTYN